ncbi:hypothetical protein Rxyl_0018 [Rubrobacter xylanophilus DSM 9941]|uniref:Uncharacterized protein n=1 Tax=Rubrobacter xylanophilus (strain DSM 9941 / JCM 11954 / NBRC 16129 / PRD-1) TaxID=266117 RepID=Q1B029_RUBXD|nr:hypothetical protein [Rubrobacter xylanophilus]ABG02999.1 hypothetical protein Rxyl_0018 [Rubrobacter xylanophilus DSM 9941]
MGPAGIPEVIRLRDARGERPPDAAGAGDFWYDPAVWGLPLSPASRVLYAGICAHAGHGEINRQDLRNLLKGQPDEAVAAALRELAEANLLVPAGGDERVMDCEIRPVSGLSGGSSAARDRASP